MHILVAGFQHETNTFAPSKAGYDNFVRGEGFPAMVRGEAMLALRQVNIPPAASSTPSWRRATRCAP